MIEVTAQKALARWGMSGAAPQLVAQRENIVFRVTHNDQPYALRLHRPGYQTARMMQSELDWIAHLATEGLIVPQPIRAEDGTHLQAVGDYHVDLLSWLGGTPMGATGAPLALAERTGTFHRLGNLMARMHQISDAWQRPAGFERKHWDIEGLLGDTPLWDRFWDNPGLSTQQRTQVLHARDQLRSELTGADLDFGLIHADMVRENVMIDGQTLGLIDFDDSGFGYRLFDVATTLFKNRNEADYADLEAAFCDGYQGLRPLNTSFLPQFMLIRALTYLGWIITRMSEPGADARQARFMQAAMPLVTDYLEGKGAAA